MGQDDTEMRSLWKSVAEASFSDEPAHPSYKPLAVLEEALSAHHNATAVYDMAKHAQRLAVVDPVLGPLPHDIFVSRESAVLLEVNHTHNLLASIAPARQSTSICYYADLEAGIGSWTEALFFLKNNGALQWATRLHGMAMSTRALQVLQGNHTNLPATFQYRGADGTGDITQMSNISSYAGSVKSMTKERGLDLCLAGVETRGDLRGRRAFVVSRMLAALLTVRKGGAFVLHLPDLDTDFALSVLYLLRLSFDDVHVTAPRVGLPTPTPSCQVICMGKQDSPTFQGCLSTTDSLASFLYDVSISCGGSTGATVDCLVNRRLLCEDETFTAWVQGAVGGVLRGRTSLFTNVVALQDEQSFLVRTDQEQSRLSFYAAIGLAGSFNVPYYGQNRGIPVSHFAQPGKGSKGSLGGKGRGKGLPLGIGLPMGIPMGLPIGGKTKGKK